MATPLHFLILLVAGWLNRELQAALDSPRRTGPGSRKPSELVQLVLRLAREDPNASCRNIQDKLRNLGFVIAKSTIHRILRDHGIEPSPERGTSWATFLKAHAGYICAADFINIEVLTW